MLDLATHLDYLQFILLEYDPVKAPTEPIMLKYFRERLKLSVLAELKYQDLKQKSFNQITKKTVDVEAKLAF